MKRFTSLTLAMTLAVALAPGFALAKDGQIKKIGLAVPNLSADFFVQIATGVQNYGKEKGIDIITVDAKDDTNTQVSQVQDLMTQGIDAFIYIPAGAAAAAVPTRLARQAGIPVVNVDRVPKGEPGDTFIAGESVKSSYQVCSYLIEQAGGSGEMFIIHGQKGTTPEMDRYKGCIEAVKEHPEVKIVAEQWSERWSQDEGFSITQNLLQAHPNVKIIFGQADGIAMGAAKAVQVANLTDQVVVGGYDGDMTALQALAKCEKPFIVTATQRTREMGRLAVDSALEIAAGKTVPPEQITVAALTTCEDAKGYYENHP
ncbi:MAG: substrate-binding domain-containing protein [Desulfopila sp.]